MADFKGSLYFPALDGLRALSILFVVIFHVNESYLPGGFIGVDIFFVISGYIITLNILTRVAEGKFEIWEFYLSRFLRLMPAAVFVAILTLMAVALFMGMDRANDLVASYFSASFWFSNIYFFLHSGYFDPISQSNPFLHFWSLSVEEQFYVFWPLIILLLANRNIFFLGIIVVMSTALSYALSTFSPQAMFYLMPARIFQFGSGAFCAFLSGILFHQRLSGAIGYMAIGLFAWALYPALLAAGNDYNFLVSALLPTLAACLILMVLTNNVVERIVGNPGFVWIGKRAYSIYLCHWPILTLASFYLGTNRSIFLDVLLVLCCLIAAEFLYRHVEIRFRLYGLNDPVRGRKVRGAVALVCVSSVAAAGLPSYYFIVGLKGEFNPLTKVEAESWVSRKNEVVFPAADYIELGKLNAERRYIEGRVGEGCHMGHNKPFATFNQERCVYDSSNGPNLFLIADSYGAETVPFLKLFVEETNLLSASAGGCLPVYPEPAVSSRSKGCQELNVFRYELLQQRSDIVAVVLATNWMHWSPSQMESTIRYITESGKRVFVIGARPAYSQSIPQLLASPIGPEVFLDLSRYHRYDVVEVNRILRGMVAEFESAHFVDVLPYFCPSNCPALFDGTSMHYVDGAHTSPDFARFLALKVRENDPSFVRTLEEVLGYYTEGKGVN